LHRLIAANLPRESQTAERRLKFALLPG